MSEAAAPAAGDTALVTGACALVSGATGFLGGHLARRLLGEGFRVRVLVRPDRDAGPLAAAGCEIARGALEDESSLLRAAAGQRFVFHTAGRVSDWGRRADFFRDNVQGTAHLIAACRSAGVERLLHVSSLTVLGLPRTGAAVDEETPCAAPPDPYSRSKIAAEELVRAAHGRGGLGVTIVRPGAIWGPGDVTIVPRLADLLRRGWLVTVGRGDNRIVLSHVDNLCDGLLLAARSPAAAGRLYHLTDGEEITAREAIAALAAALGVDPPRRALPFGFVYGAAWLTETLARLAGCRRPPAFTRYGVRLVACDMRAGIGRARTELGYRPAVTFAAGVRGLGLEGAGR